MLSVQPVRGRRMTGMFLDMAAPLYAGDPHWVAPLRTSARRFMSAKHNPYFRHADIEHFLALDGGRAVGRISATVNPAYVARYGQTGFFGWFECADDAGIARALLDAAAGWARERGMTSLAGPYSYCSTQEFGLLVDGFGTTPAAFQSHNPAYYRGLLERHGFAESFRVETFTWSLSRDRAAMEAAVRRGEQAEHVGGFTVRHLSPPHRDRDMDIAYRLFLASFESNHEVIPISRDVFDFQAAELRSFLDPRLISFVERDGEPVGFSLLMADPNEVLSATDGRLTLPFLLRYPALRRRVQGAIVLMMGARPDLEGLGVGRVIAGEIARVGLNTYGRYRQVHTTWIHEANWQSRALALRTGSGPRRTYAVFARSIP